MRGLTLERSALCRRGLNGSPLAAQTEPKIGRDVDLAFCDLPHVPPGAMGRFLLTQMASVAELEAGLITNAPRPLSPLQRHAGLSLAIQMVHGRSKANRWVTSKQ